MPAPVSVRIPNRPKLLDVSVRSIVRALLAQAECPRQTDSRIRHGGW
jgi:hypothetical protein